MRARARVAHHEAGHGVAARKLGLECLCIAMFATDEGGTPGAKTASATYQARDSDQATLLAAIRKDIIVCLARPCGEAKYRKPAKRHPDQWRSDIENVHSLAGQAALLATVVDYRLLTQKPDESVTLKSVTLNADQLAYVDELIEQCKDAAGELVDENWPAIEHVAQTLMTCDLIDQAELDRLIAAAETVSAGSW